MELPSLRVRFGIWVIPIAYTLRSPTIPQSLMLGRLLGRIPDRIRAEVPGDQVGARYAPTMFGSRQPRSNGSRQARGAISWWIRFGPHEPCW